jgi:hypothetical protein
MADIITLHTAQEPQPTTYTLDVSLTPGDLEFTLKRIAVSRDSLLTIARQLENIASIIRSDVIVGEV